VLQLKALNAVLAEYDEQIELLFNSIHHEFSVFYCQLAVIRFIPTE